MLSWLFLHWIGIAVGYLAAIGLAVLGGYLSFVLGVNPVGPLARLFHWLGLCLIGAAIALACFTFGNERGGAACEAAWKEKNLELQVANLQRDLSAAKAGEEERQKEAAVLQKQKQEADGKVADYAASIDKLSSTLTACRRATSDDDRRLCDIIGNAAPGCRAAH